MSANISAEVPKAPTWEDLNVTSLTGMRLNVMILTAGLGTRLRPYTLSMAKPAISFLGVPLALHALRPALHLPVRRLVANLHYRPEDVRQTLARTGQQVVYSEEKEILGVGGGVANAKAWLEDEENILVINGDEVFLPEDPEILAPAFARHVEDQDLATLVTMHHPEVGRKFGGVWVDSSNTVRQFSKTPVAGLGGQHFPGYTFLHRRIFNYFSQPPRQENLLYETLAAAIGKGEKVSTYPVQAHWFETGNTEDFLKSSEELLHLLEDYTRGALSTTWLKELAQFLLLHRPWTFVLERDRPPLLSRLQKLETRLGDQFA
ncbi:MAG: mannose-1-phosphate guanyltransferase [Bdellovibrio sp.]|nr:MAG: mannose-1-phosphate guanyltransferase [Bdellovibrio sp.]